jgi:gas vesicle protein
VADSFFKSVGDSALQVGAALGSIAAAGGAPPGGGHFSYQPDQLRAIIKDWDDIAASYETDISTARIMTRVKGPGSEQASESLAETASTSGTNLVKSLEAELKYCETQRKKFQDALNEYTGVEETNTGSMKQQQEGLA